MKALVIVGNAPRNIKEVVDIERYSYFVGVDSGCMHAINQGIDLNMAIGDFDSLPDNLVETVKKNVVDFVKLDVKKDDTDTYAAVKYLREHNIKGITIVGGIQGDRIEHLFANIGVLKDFENVKIKDQNSSIFVLKPGRYRFNKDDRYYSFFAIEQALDFTLDGFAYELENYTLNPFDSLCVSNETEEFNSYVTFTKGLVLVIVSKK